MRAIRELERLAAAARSHGGRLVIVRPSPIVRRVLKILDLHTQMAVMPSRGDAAAFVARHAAGDPKHTQ
jgi:anti-anti-sigma regulatory factor